MPEFLNIELMNWEDFWDLVIRASNYAQKRIPLYLYPD